MKPLSKKSPNFTYYVPVAWPCHICTAFVFLGSLLNYFMIKSHCSHFNPTVDTTLDPLCMWYVLLNKIDGMLYIYNKRLYEVPQSVNRSVLLNNPREIFGTNLFHIPCFPLISSAFKQSTNDMYKVFFYFSNSTILISYLRIFS